MSYDKAPSWWSRILCLASSEIREAAACKRDALLAQELREFRGSVNRLKQAIDDIRHKQESTDT